VPNRIFKQRDYLIAVLGETSTDAELTAFQASLSEQVGRYRSKAAVVDVGQLDVIDSFTAKVLNQLARIIVLRGACPVIVGIRPEVAFAMVRLGLSLDGVATAVDLDAGLDLLDRDLARAG
jgi:rsbT antagonist protein RsbS